jgi:hypothetical protein
MGGSVDVLAYLCFELEPDEMDDMLDMMLNAAGAKGHLKAAKWLRQQGAEWPPVLRFVTQYANGGEDAFEWQHNTLEWARAEGCTAPTTE